MSFRQLIVVAAVLLVAAASCNTTKRGGAVRAGQRATVEGQSPRASDAVPSVQEVISTFGEPGSLPVQELPPGVFRVGGEVSPPEVVEAPRPVVPEKYRNTRITQPFYIYRVIVGKTGRIDAIDLVKGPPAGAPYGEIEVAAREAISKWRYKPAGRGGEPVAVEMYITFTVEVR